MRKYDFKPLFDGTRDILRDAFSNQINITNISSADSSFQYEDKISILLHEYLSKKKSPFSPYFFTGSIKPRTLERVKQKLGAELTSGITLLPSATLSLNTLFIILRQWKIKKIAIISPYYFISSNICRSLGMKHSILPVKNKNGILCLPVEEILKGGFDAVLITSPLYGTSEYYTKRLIDDIKLLQSEKRYFIFDEALALPGHELIRITKQNDYIFCIYSPHKSIGINAFKFSAIISSANNEHILRENVETYVGGLNQTSVLAIEHYLSTSFNCCQKIYTEIIENSTKVLKDSLLKMNDNIAVFYGLGHYSSIIPKSDFPGNRYYLNAIASCAQKDKIVFLPPWPFWDNGFKINMTYPSNEIAKAINCISKYFGINRFCH